MQNNLNLLVLQKTHLFEEQPANRVFRIYKHLRLGNNQNLKFHKSASQIITENNPTI